MRIAWPELIVLIVLGALFVLGAELALLAFVMEFHAPIWLGAMLFFVMAVFDLWAVLRVIDWAFAGPARRRKQRVL
jgi:hypothetical protein